MKKLISLLILHLSFASTAVLAEGSPLNESFQRRLLLRLSATPENATQLKLQMLGLRYQEDILAEEQAANFHIKPHEKSKPAFTGKSTLLNPKFANEDLKSGDVIVMRGTSVISTVIGAATDPESLFSHTLMVYQNPETKVFFAMEALIGKGLIVHPLKEVLDEGSPRLAVYRHKDESLAQRAAQMGFEIAMKNINAGTTLPYNNSLNLNNNYASVYCAQFVRMCYDLATKEGPALLIPTFPSTLGKKFENTLASSKVDFKPITIYDPADIDLEPSFDLVMEWRDPNATVIYRIKDQIMLSLMRWIEEDSIRFDYSVLKPEASSHHQIDPEKLKAFSESAESIVNELTGALLVVNDDQLKESHRNMTAGEIRTYLETIRGSARITNLLKRKGFQINQGKTCGNLTDKL